MSTRKPFIGGNWKCNGTVQKNIQLISDLNDNPVPDNVEVVVAPGPLHLGMVISSLHKNYAVAAQNCSRTKIGAYTGEVCASQLKDFTVEHVILGHSERRAYYAETEQVVAEKVNQALKAGLKVIACIGETLAQRKGGKMSEVLINQLKPIADEVNDWSRVVIAYEPVWAIGTGVTATPEQAQKVHAMLRGWLARNYGANVANNIRIIYGGSVKPSNAVNLIEKQDIDGFLVGGCSLKGKDFAKIINAASTHSSSDVRSKL